MLDIGKASPSLILGVVGGLAGALIILYFLGGDKKSRPAEFATKRAGPYQLTQRDGTTVEVTSKVVCDPGWVVVGGACDESLVPDLGNVIHLQSRFEGETAYVCTRLYKSRPETKAGAADRVFQASARCVRIPE